MSRTALASPAQTLADLTELARKGIIGYVLPGVPFGETFTIGTSDGPAEISHESAALFVLRLIHAGAWYR